MFLKNSGTDYIAYADGTNKLSVKANESNNKTIFASESTTTYGSKTETLEVVIKNNAGTSVKKDIVVSSIAPKAATVELATANTFNVTGNIGATIDADAIRGLVSVKNQYGVAYTGASEARITYTNVPAKLSVANNNTDTADLKLDNAEHSTTAGTYTVGVTLTYNSGVIFTETLVVTVNGVALSSAKEITETTVGTLNASDHKITGIPNSTTASQLKAALVISPGATVEIVTSSSDATGVAADTPVVATNIIVVTAEDGSEQTYAIELAE